MEPYEGYDSDQYEFVPPKRARLSENAASRPIKLLQQFDRFLRVFDPSEEIANKELRRQHDEIWAFDDCLNIFNSRFNQFSPARSRAIIQKLSELRHENRVTLGTSEIVELCFKQHIYPNPALLERYSLEWFALIASYADIPLREDFSSMDRDLAIVGNDFDAMLEHFEVIEERLLDACSLRAICFPFPLTFLDPKTQRTSEDHLSNEFEKFFYDNETPSGVADLDFSGRVSNKPWKKTIMPVPPTVKERYYHSEVIYGGIISHADRSDQVYYTIISPDIIKMSENSCDYRPSGPVCFETVFKEFNDYLKYLIYTPKSKSSYISQAMDVFQYEHNPYYAIDSYNRRGAFIDFDKNKWTNWFVSPCEPIFELYDSIDHRYDNRVMTVLSGVERLEFDWHINPSTGQEEVERNERVPCKGYQTHYTNQYVPTTIVSMLCHGGIHVFDFFNAQDYYRHDLSVHDFLNTIALRFALNRYDANTDDSFANFYFAELFRAGPNRYFYLEALRMLYCGKHSLTHREVMILIDVQQKYEEPNPGLHFILAINHMRNKNFVHMEEEVYNYCYSLRYGEFIHHNPFSEYYDDFNDQKGDFSYYNNYALIITSCLNLLGPNNARAHTIASHIVKFETHPLNDDDAQLSQALSILGRVRKMNVYEYPPAHYFHPRSPLVGFDTFNIAMHLSLISDHYMRLLDKVHEEDVTDYTTLELLIHRYIMVEYLNATFLTLCNRYDSFKEMEVLLDRLEHFGHWVSCYNALSDPITTLFRSHNFSGGCKVASRQPRPFNEVFFKFPGYYKHPIDATLCENILNAYYIAYGADFDYALEFINSLSKSYEGTIIGMHNLHAAQACINFDQVYFSRDAKNSDIKKALEKLYSASPVEGLFREVQINMISGIVPKKAVNRLNWMVSVFSEAKLSPIVQMRCFMVAAQYYAHLDHCYRALVELDNGLEVALALGLDGFVFAIQRRVALVFYLYGDYEYALELLETYPPDDCCYDLPQIESAMYYYVLFRASWLKVLEYNAEFAQVENIPISVISSMILDVITELEPYPPLYRSILAEAMNYIRYYAAHPVTDEFDRPEVHNWVVDEILNRFDEEFPQSCFFGPFNEGLAAFVKFYELHSVNLFAL